MKDTVWGALNLVFELGYMIAIPIVVLGFGGALLDKKYDTSPLFILIGIVIAVLISSIAVYKKIKEISEEN